MALKFTDRPGTDLKNINLSIEEWRVVSYVNPKNTMNQIARTVKMNDLEIRRVVYGLLQAGWSRLSAQVARRWLRHQVFPDAEQRRTKVAGQPLDQPDPFHITP
jgi:hypothetical protein